MVFYDVMQVNWGGGGGGGGCCFFLPVIFDFYMVILSFYFNPQHSVHHWCLHDRIHISW